jgi:hypothetical protein
MFSAYSLVSEISSLFYTRSLDFHAKVGILALLAFEWEVVMPSLPKGEVFDFFLQKVKISSCGTNERNFTAKNNNKASQTRWPCPGWPCPGNG